MKKVKKPQQSYPYLRAAYAIIDGIPEDRFNLEKFANSTDPHDCGTIACAAGWLAMHPKFQALGLELVKCGVDGNGLTLASARQDCWETPLTKAFGITEADARYLFQARHYGADADPPSANSMTDKQLWQARVRHFLRHHP